MSSKVKPSASWSKLNFSSPSDRLDTIRPRKLSSAWGRKPASRNQVIEVGLCRLDSLERFASLLRSSGRWQNVGGSYPERLVEPQVLRQRVDPLLAADHVADRH